jgi:hypothetical protein
MNAPVVGFGKAHNTIEKLEKPKQIIFSEEIQNGDSNDLFRFGRLGPRTNCGGGLVC